MPIRQFAYNVDSAATDFQYKTGTAVIVLRTCFRPRSLYAVLLTVMAGQHTFAPITQSHQTGERLTKLRILLPKNNTAVCHSVTS
jgi:hypothetical protein